MHVTECNVVTAKHSLAEFAKQNKTYFKILEFFLVC